MTAPGPDALTIAVRVTDPRLAERVSALLGQLPGISLVEIDEPADLVLFPFEAGDRKQSVALTPREHDVIALLAEGLSNKRIARRLGIGLDTAKFHVGRLIDKLDATGRTDAVAQAARCGIIQL
jgi:DNA-binding CsgD family transcriptional regulator